MLMLVAGAMTACGVEEAPSAAFDSAGCSQDIAPIKESQEFTAFVDRMTAPPPPHIPKFEQVDARVVATPPFKTEVDGLKPAGQLQSASEIGIFYASKSINGESFSGFFASGGAEIVRSAIPEGDAPLADTLPELMGDRATKVAIGGQTGILSWDDPLDESGVRPHRITWAADGFNYTLRALRSPEVMVGLARDIVC
jgi:hypothetical protein